MLLASVIKSASLLIVQWCLWQTHNPNSVTTAYLLDLNYYHSLVVVVTYFLSVGPCSNAAHCSVQLTKLFFC